MHATSNVATRIVVLLAIGSVRAAIVTLVLVAVADLAPQQLNHLIREAVGVALLVSLAMLLLRDPLKRWAARSNALHAVRRYRSALTVAVGGTIGVAVGLTSLGAGTIDAACLPLLYPELEPTKIPGSDIA